MHRLFRSCTPLSGLLTAALLCVAGPAGPGSALPAQGRVVDDGAALVGTWRVVRGQPAPWIGTTDARPDIRSWLGQPVRVNRQRVAGPGVLRCPSPRLESTRMSAEGLFQGGLPAPAAAAARALGFPSTPVVGVRLTCDAGLFEFHQPDTQSMLVAVDNVIWTLDKSPGATAADTAPAGVVHRFLEQHFASDMAYDTTALAVKRVWLDAALVTPLAQYLSLPKSGDEAPELNGDPFTDSQEYPTRFSVGVPRITGTRAAVSVRFSDGYRSYRVGYQLTRTAGRWRITDVFDQRGQSLRASLRRWLGASR